MADFIDTNILLYSVSTNSDERFKRDRAIGILNDRSCVLSVQVLQEFYVRATRPKHGTAMPEIDAEALVHSWFRYRIAQNTAAILSRAMEISRLDRISFWDASIIAAAESAGCIRVLTEDLNHGQKIGSTEIFNPFVSG